MANDLAEQLSRIGHKNELLLMRYTGLLQENKRLKEQLAELEATLHARDTQIEQQSLELRHLRISSALAPSDQSSRQARDTIAELVREIDACVADLMKEV